MEKTVLKQGLASFIAIASIMVVVLFLNKTTNILKPEPTPSRSEYPDFEIITDLNNKNHFISLIDNSKVKDGNIAGYADLKLKSEGKFARAYLYVETSVNDKPISQFESVYALLNEKGGHLFRPNSLKTPPSNNRTRLLFALNDLSYIPKSIYELRPVGYSETKSFRKTSWFSDIDNNEELHFIGFLGSVVDGFIDAKIYYECQNGSECKILKL